MRSLLGAEIMLVPFAIDAESLTHDQSLPQPMARQCHRDLLDIWRLTGLLVHDGESFEGSRLGTAIDALPQNLRQLWQEMLKRYPPIPCRNGWSGAVAPDTVSDIGGVVSVGLVDDTRAFVEFEIGEDQDEKLVLTAGGRPLAICRLCAANHASVFQQATQIANRSIEAGERYEAIWEPRFKSLASAACESVKKISIVDRYTVEQFFKCIAIPGRVSGLERFLRLLDQDAGGVRYVSVFAEKTDTLSANLRNEFGGVRVAIETKFSELLRRLPAGNVKRLQVHMVPSDGIRMHARDRFVRFGPYRWDLGHGLDVFQGPAARHGCSASVNGEWASAKRVEDALETYGGAVRVKITGQG